MAVRKGCVGAGAVMHHLVFLCFFCTRQSHNELPIIPDVNLEHARDGTTSKLQYACLALFQDVQLFAAIPSTWRSPMESSSLPGRKVAMLAGKCGLVL